LEKNREFSRNIRIRNFPYSCLLMLLSMEQSICYVGPRDESISRSSLIASNLRVNYLYMQGFCEQGGGAKPGDEQVSIGHWYSQTFVQSVLKYPTHHWVGILSPIAGSITITFIHCTSFLEGIASHFVGSILRKKPSSKTGLLALPCKASFEKI